jgi:hypothetical protein
MEKTYQNPARHLNYNTSQTAGALVKHKISQVQLSIIRRYHARVGCSGLQKHIRGSDSSKAFVFLQKPNKAGNSLGMLLKPQPIIHRRIS